MQENSLVQFKLMIPADLKARVDASAQKNRRSLSQEIVAVLEAAHPPTSADEAKVVLEATLHKLAAVAREIAASTALIEGTTIEAERHDAAIRLMALEKYEQELRSQVFEMLQLVLR